MTTGEAFHAHKPTRNWVYDGILAGQAPTARCQQGSRATEVMPCEVESEAIATSIQPVVECLLASTFTKSLNLS